MPLASFRRRPSPAHLLFVSLALSAAASCSQLNAEDLIRPSISEARILADPGKPFDPADIDLVLVLEAGANARDQTASLEYARLFEGSAWRTNEPAVHLRVHLPEGSEEPFEAGERRELRLEGYTPNDMLVPYCDHELRLLLTIRTSGLHSLLGVTEDIEIECSP